MKIIGLNGSPRRKQSRTGQLVEHILSGAGTKGAETEYFEIAKLSVKPCIACDKCHQTGYCVQEDDFQRIYERILSADGIVLGSPVYIYQVTAQLKNWIDRLGNTLHCLRFMGKYGAVATTAGGSGEKETADYLEYVLRRTGAMSVGALSCCISEEGLLGPDSPLLQEAEKLGATLAGAIKEQRTFPEQIEEQEQVKEYFRQLMEWRREKWSWEYNYWKEKGWL